MFVVTLTYVADLTEIDAALTDHAGWIDHQIDAGVFLASGPQLPRTGSVILATGINRVELEALMREHPFVERGLATYDVVQFDAQRTAPAMKALLAAAGTSAHS